MSLCHCVNLCCTLPFVLHYFGCSLSKKQSVMPKKKRLAGIVKEVERFPPEERLNRLAFFRLKIDN